LSYGRLNKIQKRIISETLATALNPASAGQGLRPRIAGPGHGDPDQGAGPDGAPFTPPASFGSSGGAANGIANYFPTNQGQCATRLGTDVKVNQNCLNVSDASLQGRGQANNEPSISQDPMNPRHIVASDNNYIRGDGTCGAHFSLDDGRSWADSTVPNGFTTGPTGPPAFAREYWQAGGDASVAWDTRGNAYMSCQLFSRGTAASPNPDESSAFTVFRSTQNDGASWDFPGRYTTVLFDPNGTSGALEDKALMTVDDNLHGSFRDRIYVTWTEFAADGTAYIYEVHSNDYGETFSNRVLVSQDSPVCTNTFGAATAQGKCNDYDLPDCDTSQGAGADPGRACVPEKGSSTISDFRATNYPSGQVNPRNGRQVTVAFGSYINPDSNEGNGCTPTGFSDAGNPRYDGVKTAGDCANKILLGVSKDGGQTFSTPNDPRQGLVVTQSPGPGQDRPVRRAGRRSVLRRLCGTGRDRQRASDLV
jgi:hypothetical protein